MESLYDFAQEVLNEPSMEKAKARVFGLEGLHLNDIKYYESIISHFVRKKDIILSKTTTGSINYDLNKDIEDMWDIVFIAQYIYKCWNDEIQLLNRESSRLSSKTLRTNEDDDRIKEINSNKNKINDYFQKLNVKLKEVNINGLGANSSSMLESEIKELKKAIVVFQKMRDSLEHRNNFSASDGNININNEKASFVVTIPAEYIDGFNKGRIIVREYDRVLIEKTNNIVYPILKELCFDPKKIDSFFYNVEPAFLEYVLELVNYDISKLYLLPMEVFERKKEFKNLINSKKYTIDNIIEYPSLLISEVGTHKLLDFINKEKINIKISNLPDAAFGNYSNTCRWLHFYSKMEISFLNHKEMLLQPYNKYEKKLIRILNYKKYLRELFEKLSCQEWLDFIDNEYIYKFIYLNLPIDKIDYEKINSVDLRVMFDVLNLKTEVIYQIVKLAKNKKEITSMLCNISKGNFIINDINDITIASIEKYNVFPPNNGYQIIRDYLKQKGYLIDEYDIKYDFYSKEEATSMISLVEENILNVDILINTIKLYSLGCPSSIIDDYLELETMLKKYNSSISSRLDRIPTWAIIDFHENRGFIQQLLQSKYDLSEVFAEMDHINNKGKILELLSFGKKNNINIKALLELNIFQSKELFSFLKELLESENIENVNNLIKHCKNISDIRCFMNVTNLVLNNNLNIGCVLNIDDGYQTSSIYYRISSIVKILLKIDISKIDSKIPKLLIENISFDGDIYPIKEENLKILLETVNTVSELEKYPIEFFTCDISLLNEMFKKYNINVCKSIFGIDNSKIMASLIYLNSVLSKTDKNSSLDLLDVDPIRFIHGSFNDTVRYTKITTNSNVDMNQEGYLTQFVINDKNQIQRNNNEIKNHIVEKLRNSCAHFRFKLVKDQNNNILEDKIYLYDEYNNGTNNFNIIVNLKDLVEIVREVELELNSKKDYNKKSK